MSMQYVRERYGVPAKRGMLVTVAGKPGRITSSKHGYIMVRFDGDRRSIPCHPTWCVEYLTTESEDR